MKRNRKSQFYPSSCHIQQDDNPLPAGIRFLRRRSRGRPGTRCCADGRRRSIRPLVRGSFKPAFFHAQAHLFPQPENSLQQRTVHLLNLRKIGLAQALILLAPDTFLSFFFFLLPVSPAPSTPETRRFALDVRLVLVRHAAFDGSFSLAPKTTEELLERSFSVWCKRWLYPYLKVLFVQRRKRPPSGILCLCIPTIQPPSARCAKPTDDEPRCEAAVGRCMWTF